jgi:2-succinyl-6-hydroxy-2,4-cyclohexadiene-1-carboxylate synthase
VLHIERRGSGTRRLALIHGFTQSVQAWGPVAEALAERFELLALDAPGHGGSAGVEAGLVDGAAMMADAVMATGGPASWLGYSMGGRFALHVALQQPEVVERLVLVSTTGGLADPDERAARRRSDAALADRIEAEGVEAFLRWWLSQPLFASLAPEVAQLENRLGSTAAGLASSLRLAGTGTQEPLWDRLAALDMPVLVVAGALDAKFSALAARLGEAIGANATVAVIAGAGHTCHLEQPARFLAVVADWLG